MVRVPLPSVPEQPGGSNGYAASGVVAPGNATGLQLEQLGQAVARTGFAVAGLAAEQEERIHVSRVKEAHARAEEVILDADRAYRNTIGKAATDGRGQAWQDLTQRLSGIESGLGDDTERQLFGLVARRRLLDVEAAWNAHEDEQIRVREIGAGTTLLEQKVEGARRQAVDRVLNPHVPQPPEAPPQEPQRDGEANIGQGTVSAWQAAAAAHETAAGPAGGPPSGIVVTDMLHTVKAEATSLAAKKFGPDQPEMTAAFVREATSRVHAGVVADLVEAGRGTEARKYLERVEREVEPDVLVRLQGLTRRASLEDDSAQLAISIRDELETAHRERLLLATASEPGQDLTKPRETKPQEPSTMPLALPAVELALNGAWYLDALYSSGQISVELRDGARAEIERMAKDRRAAEVEVEDRVAKAGEAWLINNRFAGVDSMPAALHEKGKELGLLDDWNAFASSGRRYSTDKGLFADLLLPGGNGWFAKPVREFDAEMRRRLDPHDHQIAMAMWREANEQSTPDDFAFLTPLRRLEEAASGLKIDPKRDPEEFARFRKEVESRVNAWQHATGKKIAQDPAQLDRIFDEIITNRAKVKMTLGIPRPFSWLTPAEWSDVLAKDPEKPFPLMTPEERRSAYVTVGGKTVRLRDIPSAYTAMALEEIAKHNQELAAKGIAPEVPTAQLIAELWVAAPEEQRAKFGPTTEEQRRQRDELRDKLLRESSSQAQQFQYHLLYAPEQINVPEPPAGTFDEWSKWMASHLPEKK